MKFFVMGGTGFIGVPLIQHLLRAGHVVVALARSETKTQILPPGSIPVVGDPLDPGEWQKHVKSADVIINLVGSTIMTRWTDDAKKNILESRVRSTRMAVASIPEDRASSMTLISANAVGFYGDTADDVVTEEFPKGKGFLADVCARWQEEALKAQKKGTRVAVARFGIVLGRGGGLLGQMLPHFRLGVGGQLGTGRQWMSWIHMNDLTRALLFLAERNDVSGVINLCSPNPVTNREFTKKVAHILRKPSVLTIPAWLLNTVLGGVAEIALESQRAIPAVLEKKGFSFKFPTIDDALRDLLNG